MLSARRPRPVYRPIVHARVAQRQAVPGSPRSGPATRPTSSRRVPTSPGRDRPPGPPRAREHVGQQVHHEHLADVDRCSSRHRGPEQHEAPPRRRCRPRGWTPPAASGATSRGSRSARSRISVRSGFASTRSAAEAPVEPAAPPRCRRRQSRSPLRRWPSRSCDDAPGPAQGLDDADLLLRGDPEKIVVSAARRPCSLGHLLEFRPRQDVLGGQSDGAGDRARRGRVVTVTTGRSPASAIWRTASGALARGVRDPDEADQVGSWTSGSRSSASSGGRSGVRRRRAAAGPRRRVRRLLGGTAAGLVERPGGSAPPSTTLVHSGSTTSGAPLTARLAVPLLVPNEAEYPRWPRSGNPAPAPSRPRRHRSPPPAPLGRSRAERSRCPACRRSGTRGRDGEDTPGSRCSGPAPRGPATCVRDQPARRQRAGLVEAHGVHAAERLQGPRGPDQHPTPRQPSGSARLRHRRDQREPLGNCGHGHRDARGDRLPERQFGAGPGRHPCTTESRGRERHPRDLGQPCLDSRGRSGPARGPRPALPASTRRSPRRRRTRTRPAPWWTRTPCTCARTPVPQAPPRPPWQPGRTRRSASTRRPPGPRRPAVGRRARLRRLQAITSPGASRGAGTLLTRSDSSSRPTRSVSRPARSRTSRTSAVRVATRRALRVCSAMSRRSARSAR